MAKKSTGLVVVSKGDARDLPLVDLVLAMGQKVDGIEDAAKQYDTSQHEVFDESKRKKKSVKKPSGITDPTTGKDIMTTRKRRSIVLLFPCKSLLLTAGLPS